MIKKLDSNIFDSIIHSKFFLLIILYIIVGTIFTAFQYPNEDWPCLFLEILTNKIYLTIFIFPSLLLLITYLYKFISNNHSILIRLFNKDDFLNKQIKISIKLINYLYLLILVLIGIAVNITPHGTNFLTYTFEYNVYDFIVLIVSGIKIYLFLVLFCLISLTILNKTNNEKKSLLYMFLFIILLFLNTRLAFSGILYYVNPNLHVYNIIGFNNIYISIISSIVFYVISITITYKILKKIIINMKEIGEFKNV